MPDAGLRARIGTALRPWRGRIIAALLLGAAVGVLRFNTLGGSLGGFDNDHFLHYANAKEVEAGAQPLRDFEDGVQGARPALVYELSAAAQRWFGDNLRSEALLTVAGMAVASAVTFLAASLLAASPSAMLAAVLAALTVPKLYNYPKVLVLAVACALIAVYPRRRRWGAVLAMAIASAAAFLFRHDYAIYCGSGFVLVLVLVHRPLDALRRVSAYAVLTLLLLAPSLLWVHRYVGIVDYVRNVIEMGEREQARTDLPWPVPSVAGASSIGELLEREENTQAWFYYLWHIVPAVVLVGAFRRLVVHGRDEGGTAASLLALSVMALVVDSYFLRGSLEARFGDAAPVIAVVGAALIARGVARNGRPLSSAWVLRTSFTFAIVATTFACAWTLWSARSELDRSGLSRSPLAVVKQAARVSAELAAMPRAMLADPAASPSIRAAKYVNACTKPTDRVLVATYAPEVLAFADRRFAGGRVTVLPGFFTRPVYTDAMVARLQRESVPIVLVEPDEPDDDYYDDFPQLRRYLQERYEDKGSLVLDGDHEVRVLTRAGTAPAGTYEDTGLPCYR